MSSIPPIPPHLREASPITSEGNTPFEELFREKKLKEIFELLEQGETLPISISLQLLPDLIHENDFEKFELVLNQSEPLEKYHLELLFEDLFNEQKFQLATSLLHKIEDFTQINDYVFEHIKAPPTEAIVEFFQASEQGSSIYVACVNKILAQTLTSQTDLDRSQNLLSMGETMQCLDESNIEELKTQQNVYHNDCSSDALKNAITDKNLERVKSILGSPTIIETYSEDDVCRVLQGALRIRKGEYVQEIMNSILINKLSDDTLKSFYIRISNDNFNENKDAFLSSPKAKKIAILVNFNQSPENFLISLPMDNETCETLNIVFSSPNVENLIDSLTSRRIVNKAYRENHPEAIKVILNSIIGPKISDACLEGMLRDAASTNPIKKDVIKTLLTSLSRQNINALFNKAVKTAISGFLQEKSKSNLDCIKTLLSLGAEYNQSYKPLQKNLDKYISRSIENFQN